jgi:MinD superfamily P-loop ATPase
MSTEPGSDGCLKLVVASGKGGTGKTTVAVNLAVTAALNGRTATYIDCDVEEPNGHIFLEPRIEERESVSVPVPTVDEVKCTWCGACGEICRFSAILVIKERVLVFPELCHACGGCAAVCPAAAITETPRGVGRIERGVAVIPGAGAGGDEAAVTVIQGILDVSEAMPTPVIRRIKEMLPDEGFRVIDAPPGASCAVVETARGADFVLLVTEPTPFGLNDLAIAVETVRGLHLPMGVVINRADAGDGRVRDYCRDNGLPVMAEIPDDRRVAEVYSNGGLAVAAVDGYGATMASLLDTLFASARRRGHEAESSSTARGSKTDR